MKAFINSRALTAGLALFSMFFGAGNIIFPLAIGQFAGDKNIFSILGLILTAAVMPIAGVLAMLLFQGDTRRFFGRLGKIPGFCVAFLVIALLGPLGSTPRCIALAYSALGDSLISIPAPVFSALACLLIYLCAAKKGRMLSLLGCLLSPLLLIALGLLIVVGLLAPTHSVTPATGNAALFAHGMKEGYNTMDLLAAFFFSSTILTLLRRKEDASLKTAVGSALIGALLLGGTYIGFSYLAAHHSADLIGVPKEQLLSIITMQVGGPYAGLLINSIIGLACLTTAIALISAFADFVKAEIFKERLSYRVTLIASLVLTFVISTFEFSGISAFLGPVLQICYPGLILLTFWNMTFQLRSIRLSQ